MRERLRTVRDGVLIVRVVRDAPSDDASDEVEVGSKQWLRRLSRAGPLGVDLQVACPADVGRLQGPRAEWLAYRCGDGVIQAETAPAVDGLVLGRLGMLTAVTSALEQRNGSVGVCRVALTGCPWQNLLSVLRDQGLPHTDGDEATAASSPSEDSDLMYEVVEYSVTRIRVCSPTCGSTRAQLDDRRETLQASAELVHAGNADNGAPSQGLRSARYPHVHRWRRLGVAARDPSVHPSGTLSGNPSGIQGGNRGLGECCDEEHPLVTPLSQREREVLELVAAGASNHEIARDLVIAITTVKRHLCNIYAKLVVQSRTQAVAKAYALGLLDVAQLRRWPRPSAS